MLELGLDSKMKLLTWNAIFSTGCQAGVQLQGELHSMCAHSLLWDISPPPWTGVGGLKKKPGVARMTSQTSSPRRRATGRAAGYHPWLRGGDLRAFQGSQGCSEEEEFQETVVA